jgi:hypothetical protein
MTAPTTADFGSAPFVPLEQWGPRQAAQVLNAGLDTGALDVNRKFYLGDHWQDGNGWIGPAPLPQSMALIEGAVLDTVAAILQREIERGFTSRNVIKEVISRHVAGLLGREPDWSFTVTRSLKKDEKPSDEEQRTIDDANALMTNWWDKGKVRERLQEASRRLLYSGGKDKSGKTTAAGRAVLRLYIPRALLAPVQLEGGGTGAKLVVKDIADALSKIYVDVPDVEFAHVYQEPTTLQDVGVCQVQPKTDDPQSGQQPPIEITYVDEGGNTILGLITPVTSSSESPQKQIKFNVGKRLLMHEMNREPFITEQVRQAQRALNYALSCVPRNITTGAFLRQIILNALMPGKKEIDPATNKEKFTPDPIYRGAGSINFWRGIDYEDSQGNPQITTPQVFEGMPVPPTPSIDAKNEHYRDILNEVDQAHVLMNDDATATGKSREQARGDYETSLHITQTAIERAGRWLIETALAWAEQLARTPGKYTNSLRAVFECQIDTGPLSDAERANDIAAGQAGYLSRETIMIRANVSDPDAELRRIMEQDGGDIAVLTKKATLYGLWIAAGASEEAAAQLSGFTEAELKIIRQMVKDNPQPDLNAPPAAPAAGGRGASPPRPSPNGGRQPPPASRAPQQPARAGA